jgi:hypothetical protein
MKTAECHPNRKHQARGMCKPCYDRWLKSQNPEYKTKQLSNTAAWLRANPDKAKAIQERRKEKYRTDPAERDRVLKVKRYARLLRNYGLTGKEYERMVKAQGNKCAICTREGGDRALHLDHCHTTNKVRGLLCHQCNWYLGTLEGGDDVLKRLIDYMAIHKSPAFLSWRKQNDSLT